jgi:hypothetical protein
MEGNNVLPEMATGSCCGDTNLQEAAVCCHFLPNDEIAADRDNVL